MSRRIELDIQPQPDDSTCGPTCLQAVYRLHGDDVSLSDVIDQIPQLASGGTLAVQLASHALKRGYNATIFTYNLHLFDPTWFEDPASIPDRLRKQAARKRDPKLHYATGHYLEFFSLGGSLRFEDLTTDLLKGHIEGGIPLLTGVSATYLYRCAREIGFETLSYDDVNGLPTGHFVLLHGYDSETGEIAIADPFQENPLFQSHHYTLPSERVLGSILLGVMTYDANLLVVTPGSQDKTV